MLSPLEGRRLWLVGIGGAGMSAYAALARAWGADVRGWDRVRTPYLNHLEGIEVTISDEPPEPPHGWEVFVSSAFADRVAGRTRAELLAELVSLRESVVVAGAHGKTTTAGMIAFCLQRLGRDPAWLIGADIPQLGGNAGTGGGWLVVEGDESDRTIAALRPELAVVTNVDLDHHSTFASRAEVEALFDEWLLHVPDVVRGERLPRYDGPLTLPGEHNRRNAACALVALERIGLSHADIAPVLAEFAGAGRRLERRGGAGGVEVYDDYAHHPAEVAATLAAGRADGRLLVLFQPHLYSRTRHLASELAAALAAADVVAVTDVYAARETPIAGVSGKLVVDALAERRPGMPLAWTPECEDGARFLAAHARRGDRVLTIGAGDVDRAGPLLVELLA
ncbi:MAG TPA: cyanophycin synthetase [Gaiellaceae bacterium]|nr:cyanophycin synthetase [Gaiellaceae bacterium]